jgi:hypothetical protein
MRLIWPALLSLVIAVAAAACTSTNTSLVSPDAAKCHVAATANTTAFGPQGGSSSIAISAARDCTWSVGANANWISISGTPTGQGEATIAFSVAANPAPAARSASLAVSDAQVQLTQDPAPCHFNLSRTTDAIGAVS